MKKILMIIANNGFQDYEFSVPYTMFLEKEIEVTIASGVQGPCVWVFGTKITSHIDLAHAVGSDYDMVVFIWWGWAYSQYFGDKEYLRLSKEAKKLGAMCIATMIVSASGVFNNVHVTGYDHQGVQKEFIEKNGGVFTGKSVTVFGHIVTASGPQAAREFARKCIEMVMA